MAFDKYLGYRSQGVNPSMYSDDRTEAMRMMDEDMTARWGKDPAGFQKAMLDQRILERQGKGNAAPEEQPQQAAQQAPQVQRGGGNQMGDAPIQMPGMSPAAGFAAHQGMIAQTNKAIASEMNSRRAQAAAQAERQHEYQMEMLKQQGQQQAGQQQEQQANQIDQIRKARNRSLLSGAGLGGHTIRSGPGGVKKTPHAFGNSPFSQALLGD